MQNFLTLEEIVKRIEKLPPDLRRKAKKKLITLSRTKTINEIKNDFLTFVKHMWPDFIEGSHHKIIAKKFNQLASGEIKRLIVNMPPRHTKSEFASYLLPAWMIGKTPNLKIIQATHTAELAVRFGRKAKHLMDTEEYKKVFPTRLMEDQSRWSLGNRSGRRVFCRRSRRRCNRKRCGSLIIDDPHSEQDAMSKKAMERAYEWYTTGPRQRLQPGGRIVLVMTRWNTTRSNGHFTSGSKRTSSRSVGCGGVSCDPTFRKTRVARILGLGSALRRQGFSGFTEMEFSVYAESNVGRRGLIKREWWKKWKEQKMPKLKHVIQSYDTAYLKKETADFSAITTWGVFSTSEDTPDNLILVDAVKGRYEFPELRRKALELYKYWEPDTVIIEAKAAGLPLAFELRNMGIPVINFTPSKGNDKHTRVNAVAPLFESGRIWAPLEMEFAQEVIEECASFPYGDHDDLVDSTTQAIMRFRQGGWITHPEDYKDPKKPVMTREYY